MSSNSSFIFSIILVLMMIFIQNSVKSALNKVKIFNRNLIFVIIIIFAYLKKNWTKNIIKGKIYKLIED